MSPPTLPESESPEPLKVVAELMRAIDAYAFDYKEQGKLGTSRRMVEKGLLAAIQAARNEADACGEEPTCSRNGLKCASSLAHSWGSN